MSAIKPELGSKLNGSGHASRYITSCTICRFGIFQGQPHIWSRQPFATGLVHTDCLEVTR